MAVHKVPQDVEAEDKFLGPLSFKQFLFAGGTLILGYLSFLTITKGAWFIAPMFLIPALLLGFLAFPWSREQPTELWLASRIRFLIKPRRRIWDQSGMKDLVNITAPVRQVHSYTDGLSQVEVKSRLSALATMVDSRGWAVKNAQGVIVADDSDRLVSFTNPVPDEQTVEASTAPDILDESGGIIARQFDTKIEKSEKQHKAEALRLIKEAREKKEPESEPITESSNDKKQEEFWFAKQQEQPPTQHPAAQTPIIQAPQTRPVLDSNDKKSNSSAISEEKLLEKVHEKQRRDAMQVHSSHTKTIDPNMKNQQSKSHSKHTTKKIAQASVTPQSNPDILSLSASNDLSVETLARQANKKDEPDDGEVVISLH